MTGRLDSLPEFKDLKIQMLATQLQECKERRYAAEDQVRQAIEELNRNSELIPKLQAVQAIALELREQAERDQVTHVGDLDSEIVTRLFAYLPRGDV